MVSFTVYIPLYIFGVMYTLVQLCKMKSRKRKSVYMRYAVFVTVYCVMMGVQAIDWFLEAGVIGVQSDWLHRLGLVVSCCLGMITGMIRLSDYAIIDYFKRHGRRVSLEEPFLLDTHESVDMSNASFSELTTGVPTGTINDMENELLYNTILSLYITLGTPSPPDIYYLQYFDTPTPWTPYLYKQQNTWELTKEDILHNHALDSELLDECNRYSVHNYHCKIVEYAPIVFAHLRYKDGLCRSELLNAINPLSNKPYLIQNNLSSDHILFFTHDNKFVIKEITAKEKDTLIDNLLSTLHNHFTDLSHNKSLIARIYGVFTIQTSPRYSTHILIMQNVTLPNTLQHAVFELKGCKLDRQVLNTRQVIPVEECPQGLILKDLDFYQTQRKLWTSSSDEFWIKQNLTNDVNMLKSMGLVDYKLAVIVGKAPSMNKYCLPIRYARHTFFGTGKESHHVYFLGLVNYLHLGRQNSKIPLTLEPGEYGERFLVQILNILKCGML